MRKRLRVLALAGCAMAAAVALALTGCGGGGSSAGGSGAGSTTTGESYRVVSVDEHNGESSLTRGGGEVIALYDGLNLQSGDDVVTGSGADATLAIDSDKYLYAEENTHFWLEAEGQEGSSRTSIHVEDGSVLFRLDTKLNAAESFQVSTPNATMSIRGTCGVVEKVSPVTSKLYLIEGKVTLGSGSQTTTVYGGQTATVIMGSEIISGQNQQQEDEPGEPTITVQKMTERDYGSIALTTGEGLKPAMVEKILEFSVDSGKTMNFGTAQVTPKRAEMILNNVKAGKDTASEAINKLSNTAPAAEHEHAYTRTVEQAATCTADGTARYSCACGASYTETISALGHNPVKTARQEPTCTSSGLTAGSKCSRCDAVLSGQKEIPAKGHDWQLASVDVEPTCLEAGVSTYHCDGCGLTYTEYPAALGHDMVDDPEVSATCTTAGKAAGQHCSRCDYTTGGEEIAKLPHTYNYYGYCTNCNHYSPAHDYSYYEPTVPDDPTGGINDDSGNKENGDFKEEIIEAPVAS